MGQLLELEKIKPVDKVAEDAPKDQLLEDEEEFLEMYSIMLEEAKSNEHKKDLEVQATAGVAGGALLGASVAGPLGALVGGLSGYVFTNWFNRKKV